MGRSRPLAMVVGSQPPELCGVGDYTHRLVTALQERGHDVDLVVQPQGRRGWAALRHVPRGAVLHLQYPSVGVGRSAAPLGALLARRPSVVTIHEFSRAHPLRRAMAAALANTATRVVCTTDLERASLCRALRPRQRATVVPLGSNVPVTPADVPEDTDLAYFGLLAPGKGVEAFLSVARRLHEAGAIERVAIIGGWLARDAAAIERLRGEAAGSPLRWTGPAPPATVSAELQRARAVYLPFPDGASERRGSLLAALAHGRPVVTTEGPGVTDELRRCVALVRSTEEAAHRLCCMGPAERASLAAAALEYASRRTWPTIAAAHEAIYASLGHERP